MNYVNCKINQVLSNNYNSINKSSTSTSKSPNRKVDNKQKKSLSSNNMTALESRYIKAIYESSNVGYAGEDNPKKINQDICFVHNNFNNDYNSKYFGVWYFFSIILN